MAYATVEDVQARMTRTLSEGEISVCSRLLGDAAVQIDSYNQQADESVKELVSCRMVIRALGDGQSDGVPIGATQGSQSALGYSQSWTIGGGGGTGELYVSKEERRMLGVANSIGSYSPVEELVPEVTS
jgi:hypothetical protein